MMGPDQSLRRFSCPECGNEVRLPGWVLDARCPLHVKVVRMNEELSPTEGHTHHHKPTRSSKAPNRKDGQK